MAPDHPESPDRLTAIIESVRASPAWLELDVYESPAADDRHLRAVHSPAYLDQLQRLSPQNGLVDVGEDATLGPMSLLAARHAAGCGIQAADGVMDHHYPRAFCATRPPGHHATRSQAMGFCFFNNVVVAARHLRHTHHVQRVAIVDFDVHHGNGTEDLVQHDPDVLFLSAFQHPFYPFSSPVSDSAHCIFSPLAAGSRFSDFSGTLRNEWIPAIERHAPEVLLVSAGFDAHRHDPLANLRWESEDYHTLTRELCAVADRCGAQGRVISFLEGGYHIPSVTESVIAHISALSEDTL